MQNQDPRKDIPDPRTGGSYDDPPRGGQPDYTRGQKKSLTERLTGPAALVIVIVLTVVVVASFRFWSGS